MNLTKTTLSQAPTGLGSPGSHLDNSICLLQLSPLGKMRVLALLLGYGGTEVLGGADFCISFHHVHKGAMKQSSVSHLKEAN